MKEKEWYFRIQDIDILFVETGKNRFLRMFFSFFQNLNLMLQIKSSFSSRDLALTKSDILIAMGYSNYQPENDILDKTDSLLRLSVCHSNPSFCYKIYDGYYEKEVLSIEDVCFNTGRIILNSLKGCIRFAVFTVTAGVYFQKWMEDLDSLGDMVDRYIADCIGTEIVEATADFMQKQLAEKCRQEGYGITNRYSPGYCGWSIKEQHTLFTLLGEECTSGIRLMQSGLMYPIKSVSGIIGIGRDVKQREYGCLNCNYPKCFRRKDSKA